MMFTPKVSPRTSFTVNDTPSTATLPLTAMNRAISAGTRKTQRVEAFSGVAETAVPTPSTWPETRWPPSSSPTRSERSRLTRDPTVQLPSLVCARVSADASTANQPAPNSTAVRQQPEQAIEAPSATGGSVRNAGGVSMTRRMSSTVANRVDRSDVTERGYDAGEHGRCLVYSAQHVVADDGFGNPA